MKTILENWHVLQSATPRNSTGYLREFIGTERPDRVGSHVFKDTIIQAQQLRLGRMKSDSGGGQVISLEEYRDNLLTGRSAEIADVQKVANTPGPDQKVASTYANEGRAG